MVINVWHKKSSCGVVTSLSEASVQNVLSSCASILACITDRDLTYN
jgi:hypothetical protein